ncbi:LysR family transcriptional regulator [Thiotrichales bacterium 19X7-9]|nr:LysR family transcriptional regulator [Thiotrichales bacterium 19X7-9]
MKHQLHHIETFLQVAKNQSITQASKVLNVSKAAVSQSIRLLEESYQVPLFIRTTRSIQLTEEGKLLYREAVRLKEQLDRMNNLVSGFTDYPSGTLRVSSNPYFAEAHLVSILQEYLSQFPEVDVELYTEERMPDLNKEAIDIVIGVNFPAPDDIVRKVIGKTRYILCASPEYLARYGMPETIKALKNHHYIPHLGRKITTPIVDLKDNQLMPQIGARLKLNDAHFMKQCALKGLGIIQLHEYVIKDEIESGALVEILRDQFNCEIPLYAYFQRHRFVQPKIRQFINLLENI